MELHELLIQQALAGIKPPDHPPLLERLALAVCAEGCTASCSGCRSAALRTARELAVALRERHGSSSVADWLDGIGCNSPFP